MLLGPAAELFEKILQKIHSRSKPAKNCWRMALHKRKGSTLSSSQMWLRSATDLCAGLCRSDQRASSRPLAPPSMQLWRNRLSFNAPIQWPLSVSEDPFRASGRVQVAHYVLTFAAQSQELQDGLTRQKRIKACFFLR
ncbi:hypothetical protein BCV70DRAFT_111896 [Testicularia cyperi]|uniref:Uncharacterized protein n=1 Tax=Testicularia cyperi TaxID=1882483 RepID=A0A317XN05_9BASI|nr:hypothetical protein BCV70DRAFT_111896 [Testicularia cyperi]